MRAECSAASANSFFTVFYVHHIHSGSTLASGRNSRSVRETPEFSSDTLLTLPLTSGEEGDVGGSLVYCGSESGSCRRFAGRAGEDSREAGGEGGSSEGSGWLCGPRIYGKRVNDDRTEGKGRADFKTLQELFSGERTVEDCVRRTSTTWWERGWGIPSP